MAVTHAVPDGTLPAQKPTGSALGLKNETNRLLRGGSFLLEAVALLPTGVSSRLLHRLSQKQRERQAVVLGLSPPASSLGLTPEAAVGSFPAQPRAGLRRLLSREQPGSWGSRSPPPSWPPPPG